MDNIANPPQPPQGPPELTPEENFEISGLIFSANEKIREDVAYRNQIRPNDPPGIAWQKHELEVFSKFAKNYLQTRTTEERREDLRFVATLPGIDSIEIFNAHAALLKTVNEHLTVEDKNDLKNALHYEHRLWRENRSSSPRPTLRREEFKENPLQSLNGLIRDQRERSGKGRGMSR